jgi:hypothetical protein
MNGIIKGTVGFNVFEQATLLLNRKLEVFEVLSVRHPVVSSPGALQVLG